MEGLALDTIAGHRFYLPGGWPSWLRSTRNRESAHNPGSRSRSCTGLAARYRLLEQLFDRSPDVAFFVKDGQGRYLAVNDSLLERHGLKSKSQVIGKCPRDICPGDLGRIPTEQDVRVLRTGKPILIIWRYALARPNAPVWCLTTKLPIRDAAGAIVGLVGFSRDIRVPVEPQEIPASFARALEQFERDLSSEVTPAWLARSARLTPQRLARLISVCSA